VKPACRTDRDDRTADGRASEHDPRACKPDFRAIHAIQQQPPRTGSMESGCGLVRKSELDELLTAVGAKRDGHCIRGAVPPLPPTGAGPAGAAWPRIRGGRGPHSGRDGNVSRSAAVTWVFQIARNRRIDVKRRSRECSVPAEDFFTIPDPAAACDEHLDARQRQQYVRDALGALPQEQLALVKLAFFEGLSHSAIARQLDLPLGTVKSRLRLACGRLQRLLANSGLRAAF
jgi:RNA polymerase sigma factor (sigma-70 family)